VGFPTVFSPVVRNQIANERSIRKPRLNEPIQGLIENGLGSRLPRIFRDSERKHFWVLYCTVVYCTVEGAYAKPCIICSIVSIIQ
jgi:hypothetical protein